MGSPEDTQVHIRHTLAHLMQGGTLSEQDSHAAFSALLSGGLDEAQIGAMLALIASREPTEDELVGAARAMRSVVTPVPYEPGPDDRLIDTCGTGGAPKTFNISTAAAIVAAAAKTAKPVRTVVAKHGNRSRTGRGSAEALSQLGVNIEASPATEARCLREVGVCFSFAMRHHPAMRFAAAPRRSLGFPTIFNLLGPLTNPAGAKRQLLGVWDGRYLPLVAGALARLGAEHAMVVHGSNPEGDGLDEAGTLGPTDIAEVIDGSVRMRSVKPGEARCSLASLPSLQVSTIDEAADAVTRAIDPKTDLSNEAAKAQREIVVLNAALALVVSGAADSIGEGAEAAREAIASQKANETLAGLVRLSQE